MTVLCEADVLYYEKIVREQGFNLIAGVDEAGRGPLAGPVVAAACIIPEGMIVPGVDDSKSLTASKRKRLFDFLVSNTDIQYAVGVVSAEKIDQINILQATFLAMQTAVDALKIKPDFVLVDGNMTPNWKYPSLAVIKGDSLSHSISAASIIAKEWRDNVMHEYDLQYPGYGFAKHKGYGTKAHMEAIKALGASPIHRMSFEPLRSMH
ncbi:MAG: ribonuclease HII [Chlamydiae bacterium]|nr:ribonuclease HII [Chlamydiota bacterium]